jgi:ElaB/YqjD/DUF883 family membrane-anchored ribosome-binding protein
MEEKGREAGRLADSAASKLQGSLDEGASRLRETGAQVREKLNTAKVRVSERVEDGREKVTQHVQDHPIRTLLYAFGAGALFGLLVRRGGRRDD